jgi:hypothetical protein
VILADTNFWLALSVSGHQFHHQCLRWLAGRRAGQSLIFCRFTQISFLRLLTTERVMQLYNLPPLNNAEAWTVYEQLSERQRCRLGQEPDNVESHWRRFAERKSASPKLWMDAYLAAFAAAGGHTLLTTDQAFLQFKDLALILLPAN